MARKSRVSNVKKPYVPTKKQLAYLAGVVAGKTPGQAVHDAGYVGKPSTVLANLDKSAFHRAMHEAALAEGVTLGSIMAKLGCLMEATEEKAFVTRDGAVVYAKEQGLADIQLKATVTAADLLGISSKSRQGLGAESAGGNQVNILVLAQKYEHLDDAELEEAMQLMRVGQFAGSKLSEEQDDLPLRALPAEVTE